MSDLRSSLYEATLIGFSPKQIVYGKGNPDLPKWERSPHLQRWPISSVRYNETLRSWQINTLNNGAEWTNPQGGKYFIFSPHGVQAEDQNQCWTYGSIRMLATLWLTKTYSLRDWSRYATSYGNLLKILNVPINAMDEQKLAVIKALKDLKPETVIPMPVGAQPGTSWDLKVVAPPAGTADVFLKLSQHCDTRIATHLLGQDSSTQMKGGAYNAIEGLMSQVMLGKTRMDISYLNSVFFPALLKPLCRVVFGSELLAPKVTINPKSLESSAGGGGSQKPSGAKPMPLAFSMIVSNGKRELLEEKLSFAFDDEGGVPPRALELQQRITLALDDQYVSIDEFEDMLEFAFDPNQPRDEFGKFVSANKAGNERYRKLSDEEHEHIKRTAEKGTGEHKDAAERALAAIKKNRFGDARWLLEDIKSKGGLPKGEHEAFLEEHEKRHPGTADKLKEQMQNPGFELYKAHKESEWADHDEAKKTAPEKSGDPDSLRHEWHKAEHSEHPTHSTVTIERTYPGRGKPEWTQYKQEQVPHGEAHKILPQHEAYARASHKAKVVIYRNGQPVAVKEPLGELKPVGPGKMEQRIEKPAPTAQDVIAKVQAKTNELQSSKAPAPEVKAPEPVKVDPVHELKTKFSEHAENLRSAKDKQRSLDEAAYVARSRFGSQDKRARDTEQAADIHSRNGLKSANEAFRSGATKIIEESKTHGAEDSIRAHSKDEAIRHIKEEYSRAAKAHEAAKAEHEFHGKENLRLNTKESADKRSETLHKRDFAAQELSKAKSALSKIPADSPKPTPPTTAAPKEPTREALQRHLTAGTHKTDVGLHNTVDITKTLVSEGHTREAVHEAMREMSRNEKVELRPESGMNRYTPEQLKDAPHTPTGGRSGFEPTPNTWLRERK